MIPIRPLGKPMDPLAGEAAAETFSWVGPERPRFTFERPGELA